MRRAVTVLLPLFFILLTGGILQAQPFGAVIYVGDNSADILMFDLTNSNFSKVEFYRGATMLGTVNINAGDGGLITSYNLVKGNQYQFQYRAYRTAGGFLDGNLINGTFLGGDMQGILLRPDTINMQTDLVDTIFVWPGGNLHFANNANVSWILGVAGTISAIVVYGSDDPATVWHGVFSASGGRLNDINIFCWGQVGPLKNFTFVGSDVLIENTETESRFDNVTLNWVTANQRNDYAYIKHFGNKIWADNCHLTQEGQMWGVVEANDCLIDLNSTMVGSSIKNTVVDKGQITISPAGIPTTMEHCHIIDGNVSLSNKTSVKYNTLEYYATLNISPAAGNFDRSDIKDVHVNYNDFVRTFDQAGNVSNFSADSIDVRYNYWGRCEGPKAGERVSMGWVFLDPFLRVEYPQPSYWGEINADKKKIIANGEDSIVFTGHFFNVITGQDSAGVVIRYRVEVQGDTIYFGSLVTDAQGNFTFSIKVPQQYSQVTGMAAYFETDLQCIAKSYFLTIEKQTGPDLEVYDPSIVQVLGAENNFVPHKGFAVKATILATEPITSPFKIIAETNGHTYETFYILDRVNIGIDYSMENPKTEMTMPTTKPVTVVFFVNETGIDAGNVEVAITVDPTEPGNDKGRIIEANELNNTQAVFAVAKNTLYGNEGGADLNVFVQGADGFPNPNRIRSWADSTANFLDAAWPMTTGQAKFTAAAAVADFSYIGAADTLLQETWQPYLTKVYKQMVIANPASDRYVMGVAGNWFETRLDKQEFNHGASQTLSWSGTWDFMVASTEHWKHAAHTLGHSFGLRRADMDPNNTDMKEQYHENFIGVDVIDGYDIRYNRIVSNFLDNKVSRRMKAKCFMGGSQLPDVTSFDYYLWISDYEYNALLGAVAQFTGRKSQLSKSSTVVKALFIEGSIDSTSMAISFGPWLRIPDATPSSMVSANYATHTFKVLDAGDQEIATYLYRPTFRALGLDEVDALTGPDPRMETEYFAFVVPCPDNARKVVVEKDGNIVAERILSANKPVVSIDFPANGQDLKEAELNGDHVFGRWSATDPDGETQFWYTAWYSTNNGLTWKTLQFENTAMGDSIPVVRLRSGWMLRVVANDGVNISDTVEVTFSIVLDAERVPAPSAFNLEQNYPNPFNPNTTLTYTLPAAGNVSLALFDALGRSVATIVDGYRSAGTHRVGFDASALSSGSYLAVLRSGNNVTSIRMTLAR